MNSDYAIITLCIGDNFKKVSELTVPFMKEYAKKYNIDFIILNEELNFKIKQYNKFAIYKFLKKYKRICYIDIDILINLNIAPNIFEYVPEEKVGILEEGQYFPERLLQNILIKENNNVVKKYFNTGVIVFSHLHKNLLLLKDYLVDNYAEQTYINYNISEFEIPTFDIGWKWNNCIDHSTNKKIESFFIHYACLKDSRDLNLINQDIQLLNI
ncbi:MAG: hypothetical protein RIQ48_128 [Pseudomonadota bacterium]|jgi:lipopolysaccharide biosynthesis glycosyltransferase